MSFNLSEARGYLIKGEPNKATEMFLDLVFSVRRNINNVIPLYEKLGLTINCEINFDVKEKEEEP